MPKARLVFNGDNVYIEKDARIYGLKDDIASKIDGIPGVIDSLDSTSPDDALSANMGRVLQDQINAMSGIGNFLSTWDCTTGLPGTNPQVDPYTYNAGDYYIVSNVGATNYKPHGGTFVQGVPSTTVETENVGINDKYFFDGADWVRIPNTATQITIDTALSTASTNAVENRAIANAINTKQDTISDLSTIRSGAALGSTALQPGDNITELTNNVGYQTAGDVASAIAGKQDVLSAGDGISLANNTVTNTKPGPTISSTAPSNPTEGMLWYDSTNDVLKVYNGTNREIVDTNTNTIYAAGDGIEIIRADYSAMRGPCPEGFHIPNEIEVTDLIVESLGNAFGMSAPYNRPMVLKEYLKIPPAGTRYGISGDTVGVGENGRCWTCDVYNDEAKYFGLTKGEDVVLHWYRSNAFSIRPFKDIPVAPDSSWTTLYDGSSVAIGAGIFHNATLGLISISRDGHTWTTIADKNLGATIVYNRGDEVTQDNGGNLYQWGNNYGFPESGEITTSGTKVDASGYGPGNYYSSNVFIVAPIPYDYDWSSVQNDNLWGGETGVLRNIINNTGVLSVNGETGHLIIEKNKVKYISLPQVGDDIAQLYEDCESQDCLPVLMTYNNTTYGVDHWYLCFTTGSEGYPAYGEIRFMRLGERGGTIIKTISWECNDYGDPITCTGISDRTVGYGHFEHTGGTWSGDTLVATDITMGTPEKGTIVRFRAGLPSVALGYLSDVNFVGSLPGYGSIPVIYPDSECGYIASRGDLSTADGVAFTGIITDAGLVLIEKCLWAGGD